MLDRINAIWLHKEYVGSEFPILGWIEGPFAEAGDLRGVSEIMFDLMDEPDFVNDLLEICLQQGIWFAKEQIRAGADFIGIGDAAASLVGPAIYEEIVLPFEQQLIKEIHDMGAKVKLHICGNTTSLLELMPLSGADIIDLDWMVSLKHAVKAFGEGACPCGNFDPVKVLLQGYSGISERQCKKLYQ